MRHTGLRHLGGPLVMLACLGVASLVQAQTVDVAAAEKLMEVSKCAKCHSVDKQKDGPSYKKTATKYKGKADGETKLVTHLTTGPTIEIDGVKEQHTKIKSTDEAAVKKVARYILSR